LCIKVRWQLSLRCPLVTHLPRVQSRAVLPMPRGSPCG
jgi:hypothetical protein